MDGGKWAETPLKACPNNETIAGISVVKVDPKDSTTRGMGLPEVEELELEGWKPVSAARNVEAKPPNEADDELAPEHEEGPRISGSGGLCKACTATWLMRDTRSGERTAVGGGRPSEADLPKQQR